MVVRGGGSSVRSRISDCVDPPCISDLRLWRWLTRGSAIRRRILIIFTILLLISNKLIINVLRRHRQGGRRVGM